MLSNFLSIGRIVFYVLLISIAYNCCIAYRIFLLCGISVTGHFHYVVFPPQGISIMWLFRYCTVYPWYFCVFRPLTFKSDLPIFSIPCAGVTCMFYCTPFSGCFRGGHACFSFSHFLRFSHIISSSSLFSQSEAT